MSAEPSFADLLAAAREGERTALDALFGRFYLQVQSAVHKNLAADFRRKRPWIGTMFSTGDVVQEVFLSVLRDLDDFQGNSEAEFVGYLTTLTRNRLIDAVRFHEAVRRDRRRVREQHGVELPDPRQPDSDAAITREELNRYASALGSFRERERLLLRSRLEGGDDPPPFEQLAQQLGYPTAGAARQAFYKGKARLLVLLGGAPKP